MFTPGLLSYEKENLCQSEGPAMKSWLHEEVLYKMLSNKGRNQRRKGTAVSKGRLNSAKLQGTRSTQKNQQ